MPSALNASIVQGIVAAATWEYNYALQYDNRRGLKANVGFLFNDSAAALATAIPGTLTAGATANRQNRQAVKQSSVDPIRFALFSGHDTGPLGPMMSAFGVLNEEWPTYASMIVLEAWATDATSAATAAAGSSSTQLDSDDSTSGAYVRVLFQGRVLPVPGCNATAEGLCPLADYLNFTAAWYPTEADCSTGSTSSSSSSSDFRSHRGRFPFRVPRATE